MLYLAAASSRCMQGRVQFELRGNARLSQRQAMNASHESKAGEEEERLAGALRIH